MRHLHLGFLFCLLLVVPLSLGTSTAWTADAANATPDQSSMLMVWNRELAVFRAPLSFTTVQERVTKAAARISDLPDEALALPVTAKPMVMGTESGTGLYAGPHFLFAIAERDLDVASGETMDRAVSQASTRISELFAARQEAIKPDNLLRQALTLVIGTVSLALALVVLGWLHRRIQARIHRQWFDHLPPVFGIDLRPTAVTAARGLVRLPLILAALTAVYSYLMVVFAAFPFTRPWSVRLGDWLVDTALKILDSVVGAIPGLAIVLVIVLLTRFAVAALTRFFSEVEAGRLHVGWMEPDTARATRRIAVVLLWLFAITVSYPYLPGSSSDAFKGVSVFAGLVLTLGSSGIVNQVMSGLMVVYARSMRPGDIVQLGEVTGTVQDLGLLSTKIRTPRGEEVTIPNAVVVGATITNHSMHDEHGMVINANVTIGYDTPWRQVHAMLVEAATGTPGVRTTPEPYVVQKALDDWYVAYELRARLDDPKTRFQVQSRLHAKIQDVFNTYGVQIMSPHFEGQPAQNVVVPKEAWAPAPAKPEGPEAG